jgi:predicted secreted protein
MNPVTAIVTYLIIWWLVFLAALPFGVRGQWEDGDIARGSEPGAPVRPMLLKKVLWASIVAAGFWLVLFLVLHFRLLDIMDLPGPDSYWE